MSELRKQEQAAIEAVAEHFSATWEQSDDTSNAYISIAGKRIAVEVATVKQRIADRTALTKPRLRFDRVVRGLIARLQDTLREVRAGRHDGDIHMHGAHTATIEDG